MNSQHRVTTIRNVSRCATDAAGRSAATGPLGWMLCAAAILWWAGCNNTPPPPAANAPPSLMGVMVEVSAPAELRLADQWRLHLDEWAAATGGTFQLTEVPADAPAELPAANTALAVVPLSQVPDLIAADWPAPIEDPDGVADWEELLRGLRNGVAQPAGAPHLIPTACPVLAVYYRSDLLKAAGRRPPRTWDEYQTLLNELADWSGGLPALEPWGADFRSTLWLARAASYALHPDSVSVLLDLQSGAPLIGGPPFVQALEESLAAIKTLDPQSLEFGPQECCRAVLEGRAALAIGIAPGGIGAASERSDAVAAVGTALLPGAARVYERSAGGWEPNGEGSRVTVVGTGGYAVCASHAVDDTTRTAAWNLWTSVRPSAEDDDLPFGPAVCRARDVPAAQRRPAPGFTATEWREHLETTVGALRDTRVLLELPLPEAARFRETLTARLSAAIDGSATPADALEQAASDWRALIDELDGERVLNVYRRCHGLMPL